MKMIQKSLFFLRFLVLFYGIFLFNLMFLKLKSIKKIDLVCIFLKKIFKN